MNQRSEIMQRFIFFIVGCVLGITGCSSSVDSLDNIPSKVLLSSSEEVVIGGSLLTLNTYLWRDFAPSTSANGSPLITGIEVVSSNEEILPAGLDTDAVWVIADGEIWGSPYSDEQFKDDNRRIVKIARNGPKFDVGKKATVVIRINYKGNSYLLRASNQEIHQTM